MVASVIAVADVAVFGILERNVETIFAEIN
jgi:hypothetical protein